MSEFTKDAVSWRHVNQGPGYMPVMLDPRMLIRPLDLPEPDKCDQNVLTDLHRRALAAEARLREIILTHPAGRRVIDAVESGENVEPALLEEIREYIRFITRLQGGVP